MAGDAAKAVEGILNRLRTLAMYPGIDNVTVLRVVSNAMWKPM